MKVQSVFNVLVLPVSGEFVCIFRNTAMAIINVGL